MKKLFLFLLFLFSSLFYKVAAQTQIWSETFDVFEKGYWGGGNDMVGITKWSIDASNCTLADVDDYIKTISTSGGRIQAQDIDGEAIWTSESIDISGYTNVSLSIDVAETGSSTNANKYVNVYCIVDEGGETLFETNGSNIGNFGTAVATHSNINGASLQVVVRINNPNSGDRTIFDNVTVNGFVPANDSDSQINAGVSVEPTIISSIQNDASSPFQVIDFTFSDIGTSDGLATIINQLIISQGTNNAIADWQNAIEGAKLFGPDIATEGISGVLSSSTIVFSGAPIISVADGTSETYQLRVYLKTDLSSINDNEVLDFELDQANITTDAGGSSFAAGSVTSGAVAVSVTASELRFQSIASSTFTNQDFSATVIATDANGNVDSDFNTQVTLSLNAGSGNLSTISGLAKNASSGTVIWSDLQYNTGETFNITATTTGLTNNSVNSPDVLATTAASELFDNFEDADLSGWGNTTDWANSIFEPINGTYSLKHNLSETTGQSYIYHNLAALDLNSKSVIWRFNLKNGAWDPSSTNNFGFYLLANESDLTSSTIDGYFVGVDFEGTDDLLKLWKVTDGNAESVLIESTFDWNSSNTIGVEVIRSTTGEWTLSYFENTSFENGQIAGSVTNTDYTFTDYCGLLFNFGTASRAGLLWLDDLSISLDNTPPEVSKVVATSPNSLKILFSEKLNQINAENVSNYAIAGIGEATTSILSIDGRSVNLTFASNFEASQNYGLSVSNIEDISANTIALSTTNFTYIPFELEQVYVLNKNELLLEFSNHLDANTTSITGNYFINNGIGNALTATLENDTLVRVSFNNFASNETYVIEISSLLNEDNVPIETSTKGFTFYQVEPYDIVINEIMADPSPVVGLPEHEYIEIYNHASYNLCLFDWKIKIGDDEKTLGLQTIDANSYIIISSTSALDELNQFGKIITISGSLGLTNSQKEVSLLSNEDILVDSVHYTDKWYQDEEKDNGGWSIERIDPANTCSKLNNWRASINDNGGTPGMQNSVCEENIDSHPPAIEKIAIVAANQLQLQFNEELNENTLSDISSFILDETTNPQYTYLLADEIATLVLVFSADFTEGNHPLKVLNVEDVCGNNIGEKDTSFSYYPAYGFDVIINELMVDVNPPPAVLPVSKYIELYNRSGYDIDLVGWKLQIGENKPEIFTDSVLSSNDYIILCDKDAVDDLQSYGKVMGLLDENQLSATGKAISLYNARGTLIDYVNYKEFWYANETKQSGGWSLERVDTGNFCGGNTNWKASDDFKGGTPGKENSVNHENADNTLPQLIDLKVLSSYKLLLNFSKNIVDSSALKLSNYLLDDGSNPVLMVGFSDTSKTTVVLQFAGQFIDSQEQSLKISNLNDFCGNVLETTVVPFTYYLIHPKAAFAESSKFVRVVFSEEVEIVTAQNPANYSVNDGTGQPLAAYKHSERKNEVFLEFASEFTNGSNYTLSVENVKDLNGNFIEPAQLSFTYFIPSKNDIVINEVLFNPKPESVDFVEIYNKANMPVDLSKMSLARRNDEGTLESIKPLAEFNQMFEPSDFLAISSDTSKTKNDYPAPSYGKFIQIPILPAYNDDEGIVVLLYGNSIIDEFSYSEKMHFALITNEEGISLERIDPLKPTNDPDNWHSAAEPIGFATPANQNSQFMQLAEGVEDNITIEPETFSPNNDGFEDVVFIKYKFGEPGYVANVSIYDAKGRLIKRLATNELLGAEGEFSWDGLYEDSTKARIGIYVVYFEVVNLQGVVKKTKKTCVLAGRLD